MAKGYTIVANMKVDKTFDNKYKTSLPKVMKAAAEAAIKSSSNMTTQKPTGSGFKTYSLDATVTSLTCTADVLEAQVSMAVSEDDHMFGMLNGKSKLPSKNPKERDDDVEDLVKAVITDLIKKQVDGAIKSKLPKGP